MLEGQVLGERYRLVRELGEGTTARTFLAIEHGQLGVRKAVAVKILDHRVLSDPHRLEAVVTAARSLAKICHPNVVDVRDLYQGSDATAIVLDYIPGTTLLSILARCTQLRRPPPTAVALRLIADACFGVQALHECEGSDGPPLLHHALRPSNILVGYSGCTLITDGGLAANAEQITIDADLSSGMAQFAAPESLPGAELLGLDTVDERADIYALGVCLYVLLTLRFPYDQEELGELVAAKQQGDNVPARGRNKSISERIELLLDRALSPMPLDRHDSARELGGEIEALQGELRLTASHHLVASWLRDLLGAKIEAKQAVLRQLVAAESPPLVAQPSVMIVDHGSAEQSTSDPLEPSLAGIASSEHPPSRELSLNQRAASEDEPPLHLSDDEFAPRGPLSELPSEFPELDPLQNRRDIEQPPLEPRSSFDPSGLSATATLVDEIPSQPPRSTSTVASENVSHDAAASFTPLRGASAEPAVFAQADDDEQLSTHADDGAVFMGRANDPYDSTRDWRERASATWDESGDERYDLAEQYDLSEQQYDSAEQYDSEQDDALEATDNREHKTDEVDHRVDATPDVVEGKRTIEVPRHLKTKAQSPREQRGEDESGSGTEPSLPKVEVPLSPSSAYDTQTPDLFATAEDTAAHGTFEQAYLGHEVERSLDDMFENAFDQSLDSQDDHAAQQANLHARRAQTGPRAPAFDDDVDFIDQAAREADHTQRAQTGPRAYAWEPPPTQSPSPWSVPAPPPSLGEDEPPPEEPTMLVNEDSWHGKPTPQPDLLGANVFASKTSRSHKAPRAANQQTAELDDTRGIPTRRGSSASPPQKTPRWEIPPQALVTEVSDADFNDSVAYNEAANVASVEELGVDPSSSTGPPELTPEPALSPLETMDRNARTVRAGPKKKRPREHFTPTEYLDDDGDKNES